MLGFFGKLFFMQPCFCHRDRFAIMIKVLFDKGVLDLFIASHDRRLDFFITTNDRLFDLLICLDDFLSLPYSNLLI